MSCWNCQSDPGAGAFCAACGKVQPPQAGTTLFDVIGISPDSPEGVAELDRGFREASRQFHPDRFAKSPARERRFAVERTALLNEAYRTLRDPMTRAAYFLGLQGVDVEGKASGGMPPEFLEEMLDRREELSQARATHDLPHARRLADAFRARAASLQAEVDGGITVWRTTRDPAQLEKAAANLAAMKYLRRFLEEVEQLEMEALS